MVGIHKITSPNNRVYIGQAVDIEKRWKDYNKLDCKGQPRVYESLLKYGVDTHIFEIVEECLEEDLNTIERKWQDFYDVIGKKGLNCRLQKTSDKSGRDSEDTKLKKSLAMMGKIRPRGIDNPNFGKKRPEEVIQNMRGKRPSVTGSNNANSLEVVNVITGAEYSFIGEAAEKEGYPRYVLQRYLNDTKRNPTNLEFKDISKRPIRDLVLLNSTAKIVLDTLTGIFYYSAKEAAEVYGFKHSTLKSMLNGTMFNKTSLIYA